MNLRRPRIAERVAAELAAGSRLMAPAVVRFELEYGCAKSVAREQSRAALESFYPLPVVDWAI